MALIEKLILLAAVLTAHQICGDDGIMAHNLALGKPTHQSSSRLESGRTWYSDFAVDGKWNTDMDDSSISHTNNDKYAWWSVDLGSSQTVTEVWVTNRGDCCGDRLEDFYVGVTDDPPTSVTPSPFPLNYDVCHHYLDDVPQAARVRIVCDSPGPVEGRYVIIQLTGTNYLTLSEVEVYSDSYIFDNNLAMGKLASQSSTNSYAAGRAVDGSWNMKFNLPLPCSHTKFEANAWWSVDLGSSKPVAEVWISSRYNVPERTADFYIGITDVSPLDSAPKPFPPTYQVCSHYTGPHFPRATRGRVPCYEVLTGRHVIIQLAGTNYLHLCEVEVYSPTECSC